MRRYLLAILIVVGCVGAWSVFGAEQRPGGRPRGGEGRRWQNMPPEQRQQRMEEFRQMRERWQNMSQEEREKFRAQMRERLGRGGPMGPEAQLKAIETIEKELGKLKELIGQMKSWRRPAGLSDEERAKLREKWGRMWSERRRAIAVIEQQLSALKGPVPQGGGMARVSMRELRMLHELAVKERATQTAERLERLIRGAGQGLGPRPIEPGRGLGPRPPMEPGRRLPRPARPERGRRVGGEQQGEEGENK